MKPRIQSNIGLYLYRFLFRFMVLPCLALAIFGSHQFALATDKVTFYLEDEPIYTSKSGTRSGFLMEIVMAMSEHLDIEPNIEFLPWKRAQEVTIRTPNAIIFPLSRTDSREEKYKWLCQVFDVPVMFINKASEEPINTVEDARSIRGLGVVIGTPQEEFLRKHGIQHVTVEGKEIYARLANDRFSAVYTAMPEAMYVWQSEGYADALQYGHTSQILPLWIATSKSSDSLNAEDWQQALAKVKESGFFSATVIKYFGSNFIDQK